ncbi:MAG: RNA polymerase sigma factor [Desulfobacterales bacterium]
MNNSDHRSSDEAIIQSVLKGNVNDFEGLVRRYQAHVLNMVKRHVPERDVEETAQEAIVRAYKSLPGYRGRGRGFKAWLSAVTIRTCYDYWRKAYRSKEVPISTLSDDHKLWIEKVIAEKSEQGMREKAASDEALEVLDRGLNHLSAEDRMVLKLIYFEELTGREAARLLGWTIANVKVRAFRARRKLEKILQKISEEQT